MSTKRLSLVLLAVIGGLIAYALLHTPAWMAVAGPATLSSAVGSFGGGEAGAEEPRVDDATGQERPPSESPSTYVRGGLRRGNGHPGGADYEKARGLLECQRWDEAIEALEKALTAGPENAEAWSDLSWALLERGGSEDLKRGKGAASRALELEPDLWEAAYNLACVCSRRNEVDAALRGLERALALSPAAAQQAREDPDLEALRGEARFQELVRPR